jgi:hypothetical protein
MEQGAVMAVEKLFQLPHVTRPNFQHDLFVFHFNSVYVQEYRQEAKRLQNKGSEPAKRRTL